MDTARYKAFLASVETGSFTKAAELLSYTPSGVCQLVNALEKELGFSLLLRGKQGVKPTPGGEMALGVVREILAQEDRLRQLAAQICGLDVGDVMIGAYSSIATHWLPAVIKGFQQAYPHIRIRMMEGIRQEVCQWLAQGRIDLAFYSYDEPMEFEWIPLAEDPMLAVLPPAHPLAHAQAYPLARVETENFIMPAMGRDADVLSLFRKSGLTPHVQYSTLENFAALAMIEQGLGMSIMNELITRKWSGDVVKLPLDPPQYITMGVAAKSIKNAPPAAARFIEYAAKQLSRARIELQNN